MDELHLGKQAAYENEARELLKKLNAQGIILIVVGGSRPDADHYEVATVLKGSTFEMMKIPGMLMALANKFMDDIKRLTASPGRSN